MRRSALILTLALAATALGQTTPPFGIRDKSSPFTAYTNATVVVSPTLRLSSATVIVRDGRIMAVGQNLTIPEGAERINLTGKFIFPGFIDPYTQYGLTIPPFKRERWGEAPKYERERIGGTAWNEAVHPEKLWVDQFRPTAEQSKTLNQQGITTVQAVGMDGIFRGQSFVSLVGDRSPQELLLNPNHLQAVSFNKGSSTQAYPSSLMGSIALVRQTLLDADWYRQAQSAAQKNKNLRLPEINQAAAALASYGTDPLLFETTDELSLLRAQRIGREFNRPVIHIGSGYEYARIDDIAATQSPIIVPVVFPKAPRVDRPEYEADASLAKLRHWEHAPTNPAVLASHGVTFAFTTHRLKDTASYLEQIRRTVRNGLPTDKALAALTTVPAELCGLSTLAGTIETGKLANLVISDGDLLIDSAVVYATVVAGRRNELVALDQLDVRGEYRIEGRADSATVKFSGSMIRPRGELRRGTWTDSLRQIELLRDHLHVSFPTDSLQGFSGVAPAEFKMVGDTLAGSWILPGQPPQPLKLVRTAPFDKFGKPKPLDSLVSRVTFPNKAYGVAAPPPLETVFIRGATIWTSDSLGIISPGDIIIRDGKIAAVGQSLAAPSGATVIDGAGKHVTAGIIDEHSHICISGEVNEGTHSVTAECRIGDVVDPDDINMYRALAGGVTTLQLLHGSANPIGAQAQIVKPRWGSGSEKLKVDGAVPTIKFALGENVKQSNWGDVNVIRYPQTRMGVETIIRDGFQTAREYDLDWKTWREKAERDKLIQIPPRRDLTLETLSEIAAGKRLIHCHSYVYTEILMLMRLAEQFGFRVGTFTHILEGYRVADEMAVHGAGGSSFADWWAYKFEVYDAIPQNPCLMHERGVITSVNSDSPEMGRRLNQEAAKMVTYCGMDEQEALKLVTLYPAMQLKLDNRIGSIKPGKDADLVIWNDHPLSIYASPDRTYIDGRCYFDREADQARRELDRAEKAALVQKVLRNPKQMDESSNPAGYKPPTKVSHCEDRYDYWQDQNSYEANR